MAVSKKRMDEILQQMLDDTKDGVWCKFPDDLTEEEGIALGRAVTIGTIEDRLNTLLDTIFDIFGSMSDVDGEIDTYTTMELLKLKGAIILNSEDAKTLLIDLYSENRIDEFFLISLPSDDVEEVEDQKREINEIIETEFKDDIKKITLYLKKIIELSDKIMNDIEKRL